MDNNTRVLVLVGSSLGGDCVGLATWTTCENVAVLKNGSCVSEDKIDSSVNVAITVELAVGVNVECVLVTLKATLIENG